jgi:hypothetical protein
MAEKSEEKPRKKGGPGRPFVKGSCPNPGGRPKVLAEVRDLAREYTETAINALASIAKTGKPDQARVAAASAILDRAWGKPSQPIDDEDRKMIGKMLGVINLGE